MDFSLSGEFLATSHVGSKAIYLWSNRQHYSNIIIEKVPTKPIVIDLPKLQQCDEKVKTSHKDFYHAKAEKDETEENKVNFTSKIIQEKFTQVKSINKKVEKS